MYLIKQIPQDFIVEEVTSVKPCQQGQYSYWILRKVNYTTVRAIEHIASALGIPSRNIGFAGTKDKTAVTTQLISIRGASKDKIQSLDLKDIKLDYFGQGDNPISLGDLKANKFTIVVRNIGKLPSKKDKVLNLFGEQRFSKNNAQIGKHIVKGRFKEAVDLMQGDGDIESKVKEHISQKPNDYIGALKTINKKILMLYIHSYQSYIWNITAKKCQELNIKAKTIPIVGFGTELDEDNDVDRIISDILKQEKIDPRDFIIRALPAFSSEGTERNMYVAVQELKISHLEDDELNPGKKKCTLKFILEKASYATVAIAQMFEE